jgi:hypothetical protein
MGRTPPFLKILVVLLMNRSHKAHKSRSKKPRARHHDRLVHLRPIVGQALVTRKIQFLCGTANSTNQVVTVVQLGAMLPGFMAVSAVLGGLLTNQFRVLKISLWSPPPVQGSNTANSLKYADAFNTTAGIASPSKMVADSSMEPDRPAYCCLTPDKNSPADWFQTITSTNNFFVFTAPIGSVFEFTYQHYIDDSGTISTGPTIAGATIGTIYHKVTTLSQGMVLSPHTSVNGI